MDVLLAWGWGQRSFQVTQLCSHTELKTQETLYCLLNDANGLCKVLYIGH